jgi:hypothetical protein
VTGRLVQLVADYAEADLTFAEVVQRVLIALPEATVRLTTVAPYDTLGAGFCVAQLALTDGPSERVVIHDVGGARREPAEHDSFCAGRSRQGVLVLGPNAGWCWSFAVDELYGLCRLDVAAAGLPSRSRDLLPQAIAHTVAQHPHAVCDDVPRSEVPPVPESAVAYVDCRGSITTTIPEPPAAAGERVVVRIAGVSATAVVAGPIARVPDGELALASGASGWRGRDGRYRRFVELIAGGGSAAARFANPPAGARVTIRPAGATARRRSRARQQA